MNSWGYCYLILFDEAKGIYKIGYGKSADKRLRHFQGFSVQRLYMIDKCYCYHPKLLEGLLHDKYAMGRVRKKNELFRLSDGQVAEICATFRRLENTHIYQEVLV